GMAANTFKVKQNNGTSGKSIFSSLEKILRADALVRDGVPEKFIPFIIFRSFVGIFYIGNNHYTEKMIRNINKMDAEVEELRADYTSLKAEYMIDWKQSEVARKVTSLGLEESLEPPYKIKRD